MKKIADKIHSFQDAESALQAIESTSNSPGVSVVSFINAHAYTMADASLDFEQALMGSDILFRDGIGAKLLLKAYKKEHGYNANGTDLIPLILENLQDKTFCFIGTESPYIEQAMDVAQSRGVKVVAVLDGFNDTKSMFDFVTQHKPQVLVLGMGMPKQEYFAMYLKQHYQGDLLVINGGAIFDFLAQRFKRAPKIFRNFGLEWLYRLLNEPARLFKRYVIGIPKFLLIVWKNKRKESKNDQ